MFQLLVGRARRSPKKVPTSKDLKRGVTEPCHMAIWREKVLSTGNKKCKVPGVIKEASVAGVE